MTRWRSLFHVGSPQFAADVGDRVDWTGTTLGYGRFLMPVRQVRGQFVQSMTGMSPAVIL